MLSEWDYEKNSDKPSEVMYGTRKKYWWIGKECNHSYIAALNKRTSDGTGCPFCCKSHAKLLQGFNDLSTTDPDIALGWDYQKNGALLPNMVMRGQHRKVWWKGECGHSWLSTIYHRVQGRGCPICRKENTTSFPEQAVLYYMKTIFLDVIANDRDVLDGKELDVYIPSIRTGIEFDGSAWHKEVDKDEEKNTLCIKNGIRLIRIRDTDCGSLSPRPGIFIIDHKDYSDKELKRCLNRLSEILNTTFEINLKRDRKNIYSQYITQKKERSLAAQYPYLCSEWDYEKNHPLTPDMVTSMSDKSIWWKCKNGHSWCARVHSRSKGSGCPICSNNYIISGENDLATTNPEIIKNWDYDKNTVSPHEISSKKQISIWLKCDQGHSYKTSLKLLIKNDGKIKCPRCMNSAGESSHRNKHYRAAFISIEESHPVCLSEWDYEKNIIKPNEVTAGSDIKVWWKCNEGHSYSASLSNHLSLGRGCPYCGKHKLLTGYNDLATVKPEVIPYWNYEKNSEIGLYPEKITSESKTKAWWTCKNGHTRMASIGNYKAGSCPICSGTGSKAVKNIDTGEVFRNLTDAAKSCGLVAGDTISLCCKGKQSTAGGYHWEYVEKEV
jgi:hypothetical protein